MESIALQTANCKGSLSVRLQTDMVSRLVLRDTAPMNKAGKAIVTVGLLAIFGAAAYFSLYQTGRQPAPDGSNVLSGLAGRLTGVVPVEELSGLIALDVEPYFQDPRVQKALAANGFKLNVQRIGSRDMAGSHHCESHNDGPGEAGENPLGGGNVRHAPPHRETKGQRGEARRSKREARVAVRVQ